MKKMKKIRYMLLTFDLEEFVRPIELGLRYNHDELIDISRIGLRKIISIVKKSGIFGTFFVTFEFAQHCKAELRSLVRGGNEIGLHAYSHSDDYKNMSFEETLRFLKKAKKGIERITGRTIYGFRAPQMVRVDRQILKEIGIIYDSSSHPTIAFDPTLMFSHYSNFFGRRGVYEDSGIIVVPVSVTPLFRLPFSWIWFRNFGLTYAKMCSNLCLIDQDFINLYFHPWDFIDVGETEYGKKVRWWEVERFYKRNSGELMIENIERYIKWAGSIGLRFSTIWGYLHESKRVL